MISRPPTLPIGLSDDELAKLGLTVAIEAQAKTMLWVALRALAQLDHAAWLRAEKQQMKQLLARLAVASTNLDPRLGTTIAAIEAMREDALRLRHTLTHVLWASNDDSSGVIAIDYTRDQKITRGDLDRAVEDVAQFADMARSCMQVVADIVDHGELPERIEGIGYSVRATSGRLVRL